jgi:hypothetical protein
MKLTLHPLPGKPVMHTLTASDGRKINALGANHTEAVRNAQKALTDYEAVIKSKRSRP